MIQPEPAVVSIKSIDIGTRARKVYKEVEALAADIQERGLMHPIVLEQKEDNSGYLLIAGGRRFKAITEVLKWEETPANVYPPLDEYDRRAAELAENINREDLTFVERAKLVKDVQALYEEKFGKQHGSGGGHSQGDTAKLFGVSRGTVQRDIELANALEIIPALKECKTASEAIKKFKRLEEALLKEEISKRAGLILSQDGQAALKKRLISNYHVGDFFKGAAELPSSSFHVVEVDPPYGIDLKNAKKGTDTNVDSYNEVDQKDYKDFLDKVIAESNRLLLPDAWLILWFAPNPWYHVVEELLKKHGFTFTHPAIWTKPSGQTMWPDRYMASCYEPFFYARKGRGCLFKQGRSNVFDFKPLPPEKKTHPTERPIPLMQAILECLSPPSGRVLVPFGGSGNTLLAATNIGMTGTCWDLTKSYKDAFIVKVLGEEYGKYGAL